MFIKKSIVILFLLAFQPVYAEKVKASDLTTKLELFHHSSAESVFFIPPKDWLLADPQFFASSVKAAFVGKNKKGFTPSVNLASEEIEMSLDEYVAMIQKIHGSDHQNSCRNLGVFQTKSGPARVIEVDTKTEWGPVRLMQCILVKNKKAYILTAAASKDEFLDFYGPFAEVFRSLTITANLFSCIAQDKKKEMLNSRLDQMQNYILAKTKQDSIGQDLFSDSKFQKKHWRPFEKFLKTDFKDLGPFWQALVLSNVQEELAALADRTATD